MSAQLVQTWAVASQSILHWRTQGPGVRLAGTRRLSTTARLPQGLGMLPEQRPGLPSCPSVSAQGGGKLGSDIVILYRI